jgi:hypothetical protein
MHTTEARRLRERRKCFMTFKEGEYPLLESHETPIPEEEGVFPSPDFLQEGVAESEGGVLAAFRFRNICSFFLSLNPPCLRGNDIEFTCSAGRALCCCD